MLVEHRLVLESVVAVEVVFAVALEGSTAALVGEKAGEAVLQCVAEGNFLQIGTGYCVLCLYPLGGLG